MDREMMGQVLDDLIPGDSTEIDEVTLGMLFPPGEAAGVIDERTRSAATRFARDHGWNQRQTDVQLPSAMVLNPSSRSKAALRDPVQHQDY